MGNCVKPIDPLSALIPRSTDPNVAALKDSTVPIIFLIGGPGAGKGFIYNFKAELFKLIN